MQYKNKWLLQASAEKMQSSPIVNEISKKLGIKLPTAQLLVNRGCITPSDAKTFLAKEEEQLHDPFLMLDMDNAAYRIIEGIENGDRIVIYGDYDVDGVTSVSSLYLYLKSKGADVSYYIPCRIGEGYGVSEAAVKKLHEDGCDLIITVDTGITAVNETALAHELGIDIVVTDHHECHGELPLAEAVVNPRRPDCIYPFKELAGVGVVFKLMCAIESVMNPEDEMIDCVRRISMEYGDLVAIGTIADVMPINDENRLIVSYGLSLIENSARPGLVELIESTRSDSKYQTKRKITTSFIGYTIAPRINAAGRISEASIAVKLFLAEDCETAAPIAKQLCEINRERQNEENKIVAQAYARIDAYHDLEHDPVIILDDEEWHHGIIGIVASRITEKYASPSIMISFEGNGDEESGEDLGKGSGRSVKGLNLVDALSSCTDILEKYGGHELAAGLTIKRKNLPELKRRLNEYARECLAEIERKPTLEADLELTPDDITMEQTEELYCLEPFGVSNPIPVFVMKRLTVSEISLVGGGKHTRLMLNVGKNRVNAMCFRHTLDELCLFPGDTVDVMFSLDINEFQNQKSIQMIIKDIRLSEREFTYENNERAVFERIKNGAGRADFDVSELSCIVPTHSDFAAVYSTIRRETRLEHEVFSLRALINLISSVGERIGYVKLRFILMVFTELKLLEVKELDKEKEIFAFKVIATKTKTNLDNSVILRKLRSEFGVI